MQRQLKCHIFLTGMPGCGKSSVGKRVARNLQLQFYDTDEMIEQIAGCSTSDIFAIYGEEKFRKMETGLLALISTWEPAVISTGGGMVVRDDNRRIMQNSGAVVFIDRPVEKIKQDIDMARRPLLASKGFGEIDRLYQARIGIYRTAADCTAANDGTWEDAVDALEKIISLCMD